ncbi:MAG TPA: VOC family protein [Solirubrobacterales bacterium]|nr:VOC family protein [Solirubrobacterales bacterium]
MLHHVTLEISAGDGDRFAELLGAIGFAAVAPPAALREGFRWFEREGTQVHLAVVATPAVPPAGHAAFVVAPLDPALARLAELGFEAEERRRHWGARRVFVTGPAGHRIELMEAPPEPA